VQSVITGEKRVFSFENFGFLFLAIALCFVFQATAAAQEEVIWMQGMGAATGGGFSVADFGPAQKAGSAQFTTDSELADDINLTGTISRVDVRGFANGSPTPSSAHFYGLNVRFYAVGADSKPGALQAEYFVAKDSSNFLFQNAGLGDLRVRLAPAFQATGRHFLAVQVVIDPSVIPASGGSEQKWYWRSDNADAVRDEGFYYRANPSAAWGRDSINHGNRNLSMRLWGTRILVSAPVISQISANNLPQAGRLKITGSGFGNTQGTSTVRINGAVAPVSTWKEDAITAYVSDASTIGAGSVEVVTEGGTSNAKPFTVRARPQAFGRVLWRFQADDSYIIGRPAIGTDGTIYAAGVSGHLYALTPSGGVKWVFRGSFPVMQSVSVGADNTAYFAGGNVLYAINPNGTLKWQIANPNGGAFVAGPNVGPDGNIYAVANIADPNNLQLGAITVSPAGQILNNRQGYLEPRSGALFNREIVFGSNQFYFGGLNNLPFSTGGLEVFQLGGNYRFTISAAGGKQPAVAPDGTIYAVRGGNTGTPERLGAFSPTDGSLLRTILPTETYLGHPDIGADGTIYITHNLSVISGYTPNGANLWNFDTDGIVGNAIVNPQNTIVTAGGYDIGAPGYIYGLTNTGQSIWTIQLPAENGNYVRTMSRARFTPDGETVYYGTDVNSYADDVYSYLYAVSASANLPCSSGITPDSASYQYNGGSGNITIASVNATCQWTAASNASWITVYNTSGTGSDNVAYTVTANPNFAPRTGTITVAGQTFTVTQGARTTTTSVSITSPSSGAAFTLPANIFVSANATNVGGTIARVEFYANGELIGTDTSAPYQIVWNDVSAMNYTLVAKSIDENGVVTLSEPVAITVYPVPPPEPAPLPVPPPTLTNPTANQQFVAGESITFNAVPGASQYPVDRVEFYLGTTLIGSDTTSPYSFTLNAVPAGIYTISARTVAVTGAQATSPPIDISVTSERNSLSAKPFDFDGDNKTDISIFRPTLGEWWYLRSSDGQNRAFQFGASSDKLVPADYTGDGKTDVAFWRNGEWFVLRSEDGSFYSFPFGTNGDVPVVGDFDADGKADAAVFRPSNATWYINKSSGGTTIQQFGQTGDVPVVADYDGDGKSDIAIYRVSAGEWWINRSTAGLIAFQFGNPNDKPVQGDYTGDGKADVAFFRPTTGEWFVLRSENQSYYSFPFGANGDIPAPGDYDGDGKLDATVFRSSNTTWYSNRTTAGTLIQAFGQSGDKPVPNSFVP
jgi:Bacterial Ig domain/Putative binding domain, N-terminal/FG-GAP-like repeat/PQQ-like domain/IPT/TIG domain